MRKFFLPVILISVLSLIARADCNAQLADLKVGQGTLKIGTVLQAGYDYSNAEDSTAVNGQFTLNRARFLFWGEMVPGKVKYFVQNEMRNGLGILDYKMIFTDLIPKTTVSVGRWLPNFTHYMPRHTGKLDMINYPLFLIDSRFNYAVWRQTGIQTNTVTENMDITTGIFNGPNNNINDNNDGKDVLLRAGYKPKTDFAKVKVGAYTWLGNLLFAEESDMAYNRFGFFGLVNAEKFTVNGELVLGRDEQPGGADDLKSMGLYGHAEYRVNPHVGILGRVEVMDPNTDTGNDRWTWITIGLNRYIESYHAMVYVNYIHRIEENDWGTGSTIKNDVLLLQFQVSI
ncbi:MAG: outer membrane beta-barrel protein [Candidatus Glassbacteria bacterium]